MKRIDIVRAIKKAVSIVSVAAIVITSMDVSTYAATETKKDTTEKAGAYSNTDLPLDSDVFDATGVANLIQEGNYPDASKEKDAINQYRYSADYNDSLIVYSDSEDWVATTAEDAYSTIYNGLVNMDSSINIRSYEVTTDKINDLYSGIINDHPELFYVTGGYLYSYTSSGYITSLSPKYIGTKSEVDIMKGEITTQADKVRYVLNDDMSNIEKALAVHDYLATDVQYDYANYNKGNVPAVSHTVYGSIVNKIAVCDGYALAYRYYLKMYCDIDAVVVTSWDMNHAWNLVNIDGEYYHVDVTWDDPITKDYYGNYVPKEFYVGHNYFLFSDTGRTNHYGWEDIGINASNTKYDTSVWNSINTYMNYYNGEWYYTKGYECARYNFTNNNITSVKCFDSPVYIAIYKDKLFYNCDSRIYLTDTNFNNPVNVASATLVDNYSIDGLGIKNNTLYSSCGGSSSQVNYKLVTATYITSDETEVYVDEAGQYTLKYNTDGAVGNIVWKSGNTSIATIDANGIVTGVANGTTYINTTIDGITLKYTVIIRSKLTGMKITPSSNVSVKKGETRQLGVVFQPTTAEGGRIIDWSSNDKSVATVDSSGYVYGVKTGNATITAECEGVTATCLVAVVAPMNNIEIDKASMSLDLSEHESGTLNVSLLPVDSVVDIGILDINWTSSDPTVATVSSVSSTSKIQAEVTPLKIGTTIITVVCEGFVARCRVSVVVPMKSMTIMPTDSVWKRGREEYLTVQYNPTNTTDDTTVNWKSSDTNIATVNSNGLIKAVGIGDVTITAICGNFKDECSIKVVAPLEEIVLNSSNIDLDVGEQYQLLATPDPIDTTDAVSLMWSSDNTDVATVDSNGKITAIATGRTTINVSSGKQIATCVVVVTVPITGITLSAENITLKGSNASADIYASFLPIDYSEVVSADDIIWSVTDNGVATIKPAGMACKITSSLGGTANLTVSYKGLTATCKITVEFPINSIIMNKSVLTLEIGESDKLIANIYPSNTTDSKTCTWTSSNPTVAIVDQSGNVTAISDGETTITAKCNSYTTTCVVTVNKTPDPEPTPDPVEQFVQRMYTIVLNREAENEGMMAWTGFLKNGQCSGAQMLQAFIEGDEFKDRGLSDDAYMNVVYQAVMGRNADEDGKAAWMSAMESGVSRTFVLNGFVGSTEFGNICASYGITIGDVTMTEGRDRNYNVTCFVQRFYTKVLNRAAEADGLNTWCDAILDKKITPQAAAELFVFSDETKARNLSDSEYILMLYRTFMGRECEDLDTLNGWVDYMNSEGQSRETVFEMFASSSEFATIVAGYGLNGGDGVGGDGK